MNANVKTFVADKNTRDTQLQGKNKLRQERNRAYLLIVGLVAAVISLSIAVATLAEIHEVIPVVSVQDAYGHVLKQQVVTQHTISEQDSFIQSKVYDFIRACNTFDPDFRQYYSDLCHLHATPEVAAQYDEETASHNPNNPYYKIGERGKRYPDIRGINPVGKNTYQVSFISLTVNQPGAKPKPEYYTALVKYTFTYKPVALADRWENALGFVATAYRKDQELSRQ